MQRIIPLLMIALLLVSAPLAAQDNALRDGGMEGAYTSRGRADLNLPADWSIWFTEAPRSESWQNLPPVAFPHNGPGPNPHSGARAVNLNKGFATFTAALYQQVSVQQGTNVTASAWAFLKVCDIPDGFDNCTSSPASGAYTRVGIDPNGGTNPYDSDIVWSGNLTPHETWGQMTVSATTTGTTATVFLFATQQWPLEVNNVYWDDAAFTGGGAGGAAPAAADPNATPIPPVPQEVGFVAPQNEQNDGSLVHVVQPGDTIDSIAVAYGMTRADVLAVNPDIRDPRIIQIGQRIVIRPSTTPTPAPTPEVTAEVLEAENVTAPEAAAGAEVEARAASEATSEATEAVEAANNPPPAPVESAPPAPIRSVASGDVLPAIDPMGSSAEVCVSLFEDGNANRVQEGGESMLPGGTITLTGGGVSFGDQAMDGAPEPLCFSDLAAGDYTASMQAPSGYGLTTPAQLTIRAITGTRVNLAFGAAQGVQPVTPPPADSVSVVAPLDVKPETGVGGTLPDNAGLIAFGAAAAVLVIGGGISLLLRRR